MGMNPTRFNNFTMCSLWESTHSQNIKTIVNNGYTKNIKKPLVFNV